MSNASALMIFSGVWWIVAAISPAPLRAVAEIIGFAYGIIAFVVALHEDR